VTDLLSKGKLHATEMITHRFPLVDINEAFAVAADKQGYKVHQGRTGLVTQRPFSSFRADSFYKID
jgi:hypothetical protein